VSALDRKLVRDVRASGGQLIAIIAVVICGVAAYVAMMTNYATLTASQRLYYDEYRFADVFAGASRAPERLRDEVRAIPGVTHVDTRVRAQVRVDVPSFPEPVLANLVSLGDDAMLNEVHVRYGHHPRPRTGGGDSTEVLINDAFARAHDLALGDEIFTILNGRWQRLRVVGFAMSPEFVFNIAPGSPAPDDRRFATLWMHRDAVAAAFDFEGAFNDLSLSLAPGTEVESVIERVDVILDPYGGRGAHGRERQPSHRALSEELKQLESFGLVVPAIFLGVAAFLLNVVLSRLIQTQREQIAVLKALGYGTIEVAAHFAKFVAVIVVAGCAGGVSLGAWLGGAMAELYRSFFAFPELHYALEPREIMVAVTITAVAAGVGTWRAVARAVRLPPAEAMRPQAPAVHRRGILEWSGLGWLLGAVGRMSARNLLRHPLRAGLTAVGLAFSVAIIVVGTFSADAIDYLLQVGYGLAQRDEVTVTFNHPMEDDAVRALTHLPGVRYVEGTRSVPVRLRSGHKEHETAIVGLPIGSDLRRLVGTDLDVKPVPREGVVLSAYVADAFGIGVGDHVTVEVLDGAQQTLRLPVANVLDEMFGTSAYMEIHELNARLGEGPIVSGAMLEVEDHELDRLYDELIAIPGVATVTRSDASLKSFLETSAEIQRVNRIIMVLFASTIAVGVVYNSARIAFQERSRELASLRVMGFSRAEVTGVLLGELAAILVASLPLGWVLGYSMVLGVLSGIDAELYRFPLVINLRTYAFASVVVLSAGVAAALLVRRGVDKLDMIGVLKTRD